MGNKGIDYNELWKQAKGSIKIGDLTMAWDYTGGLSKSEFIKRKQAVHDYDTCGIIITKSGRILMPKLNIY